jgi:nucleoside-diphosphate-sugar epimerase
MFLRHLLSMVDNHLPQLSLLGIPREDLDRCHDILGVDAWRELAGQRIFITGGTGFVGKWLLATLLDANQILDLRCHITVLSRDPLSFQRQWPETAVNWVGGDIRDFKFDGHRYDVIIHAATDVVMQSSPEDVFATCIDGTRRILEFSRHSGASKVLVVSSGAVYGTFPEGTTHVSESYTGGPDPLLAESAYGEGKRAAEWLAAQAARRGSDIKVARIFAIVGPHLPLDKQFAIGNFLQSAMAGEEITVKGDGTPHRSYLYAADMAAWLWAVLFRGKSGRAYNVGSEESVSILSLAQLIASQVGSDAGVRVLQSPQLGQRIQHYVPDTCRACFELKLAPPMPLQQAIDRTVKWHRESAA